MAKHRHMFYHVAGTSAITVEVLTKGQLDGEEVQSRANKSIDDPEIMAKVADLETAIDALLGLTEEPKVESPAPPPEQ